MSRNPSGSSSLAAKHADTNTSAHGPVERPASASTPLQNVLSRLKKVRKTGTNQWEALCPAHDDSNPSLGISEGEDGQVLLTCRAGCETKAVLVRIGLTMADLFRRGTTKKPKVVARYVYEDENGRPVYRVCRTEPKDFFQQRWNGQRFVNGMKGVRRAPYRLPEVISANGDTIFICEGEKDCDNLNTIGLTASTNPGGAGNWRPDFARYFRGKHIAVIADNDDPGRNHARMVADNLLPVACDVRVIALPNLPPAGDVSDWLDQHGSLEPGALHERLRSEVEKTRPHTPQDEMIPELKERPCKRARIVWVSTGEMRRVRWLVRHHFPLGKLSIIAGLPGTTKSMFVTYLIAAMQGKVTLPDLAHNVRATVVPGDALVITCEDDPEDTIAPRLAAYGVDPSSVPILRGTETVGADGAVAISLFDLNNHLDVVEDHLAENPATRLLVLDPIQTFMGETELNGNADVNQSLTRLTTLAQAHNVAVVLVMHHNKKRDGSAMDRVIGSRGFSGTARAMWTVTQDPDDRDRHIMACSKMQYAPRPLAMANVIRTRAIEIEGEEEYVPYLEFEGSRIDANADELVQPPVSKKQSRENECAEWIEVTLRQWGGPMSLQLLRDRAKEQGYSNDTFHRAKRGLDPAEVKVHTRGRVWVKYVALRHQDFETSGWEKVRRDLEEGGGK